jgi:hypothetical protein
VLAASVAVVTSVAFGIDTTLRIGAACYLLVGVPAMVLMSAGVRGCDQAYARLPVNEDSLCDDQGLRGGCGCSGRASSSTGSRP